MRFTRPGEICSSVNRFQLFTFSSDSTRSAFKEANLLPGNKAGDKRPPGLSISIRTERDCNPVVRAIAADLVQCDPLHAQHKFFRVALFAGYCMNKDRRNQPVPDAGQGNSEKISMLSSV